MATVLRPSKDTPVKDKIFELFQEADLLHLRAAKLAHDNQLFLTTLYEEYDGKKNLPKTRV